MATQSFSVVGSFWSSAAVNKELTLWWGITNYVDCVFTVILIDKRQMELCTFLHQTRWPKGEVARGLPTLLSAFVLHLIHKNMGMMRNVQPAGLSGAPATSGCCLHCPRAVACAPAPPQSSLIWAYNCATSLPPNDQRMSDLQLEGVKVHIIFLVLTSPNQACQRMGLVSREHGVTRSQPEAARAPPWYFEFRGQPALPSAKAKPFCGAG